MCDISLKYFQLIGYIKTSKTKHDNKYEVLITWHLLK